jgi:hypothetical protein
MDTTTIWFAVFVVSLLGGPLTSYLCARFDPVYPQLSEDTRKSYARWTAVLWPLVVIGGIMFLIVATAKVIGKRVEPLLFRIAQISHKGPNTK